MHSQEKKKNPRNTAMMLDMLHIVVGVLVVACTVLAFVNPERNSFLFPMKSNCFLSLAIALFTSV